MTDLLDPSYKAEYELLHSAGMEAKDAGEHFDALAVFGMAEELAVCHDDGLRQLNAMVPLARSLWSIGEYDAAMAKLDTAAPIAQELKLSDEEAIIYSNIGRVSAVKTIHTVEVAEQAEALRTLSVPYFVEAFRMLKGHPHLYYRYANAQHGSVVAALAGEREVAKKLIAEGLLVAPRVSPEPFDAQRTYKISRSGIPQMAAAAILMPLGNRTPLASKVRSKLVA